MIATYHFNYTCSTDVPGNAIEQLTCRGNIYQAGNQNSVREFGGAILQRSLRDLPCPVEAYDLPLRRRYARCDARQRKTQTCPTNRRAHVHPFRPLVVSLVRSCHSKTAAALHSWTHGKAASSGTLLDCSSLPPHFLYPWGNLPKGFRLSASAFLFRIFRSGLSRFGFLKRSPVHFHPRRNHVHWSGFAFFRLVGISHKAIFSHTTSMVSFTTPSAVSLHRLLFGL
jgi:hypothetical protein